MQQLLDRVLRAAGKVHVMLEPSQVTRLAMAAFVLAYSELSDAVIELDKRVRKGEPMPPAWAAARAAVFTEREAAAAATTTHERTRT
jgi:hypothetical protein